MHAKAKQDALFWDAEGGGYYLTPSDTEMPLIVRSKDFMDGLALLSLSLSCLKK